MSVTTSKPNTTKISTKEAPSKPVGRSSKAAKAGLEQAPSLAANPTLLGNPTAPPNLFSSQKLQTLHPFPQYITSSKYPHNNRPLKLQKIAIKYPRFLLHEGSTLTAFPCAYGGSAPQNELQKDVGLPMGGE
jgi:hypothetical protein